ncbi:ADP-ribose 1''-phosphate phosphatase [Madurella fahalii]|uniref:ADP-ribose 1''-phosphate phosphatase n=1 Tax=Madurella fahalii TaxID=1157608 RepID=A0ABQ0GKP8_9PEZI
MASSVIPLVNSRTNASNSSGGPSQTSPLSQSRTVSNPNKHGRPVITVSNNQLVGDAFFAGTIYSDKDDVLASDEETNKTYLGFVQALSRQWPRLKYLADFIATGTSPKKALNLAPLELMERQARVKVALVDFTDPKEIMQQPCENREALAAMVSSLRLEGGPNRNRLFVVEDLSSTVIETLGAALDIDPAFFRDHLEDHTWYNIRDEWVEMPELESQSHGRSFVTLRYAEARYFENEAILEKAKERTGEWNVLRRIDTEGQVKAGFNAWWEDSPHRVGLVRKKISIWARQDKNGWTGVLLVDPHISEGQPLWKGYGSLDSRPSKRDFNPSSHCTPDTPLLLSLLTTISNLSPLELEKLASDPERITSYAYPFVFAETLVVLQYTFTGLFQIEWQLDSERKRTVEGLEDALNSLHKWQRRLPFYVGWVRNSITALEGRYSLWASASLSLSAMAKRSEHLIRTDSLATSNATSWQAGLKEDFVSLLEKLQSLQLRADKIMEMAVAIISVEESKKAMLESRNMGRITYLAFFFVPMSFITSFLSMNENISSRSAVVYVVFFAAAVPLSLLAMLLAAYWNNIITWWEKRQVVQIRRKTGRRRTESA